MHTNFIFRSVCVLIYMEYSHIACGLAAGASNVAECLPCPAGSYYSTTGQAYNGIYEMYYNKISPH